MNGPLGPEHPNVRLSCSHEIRIPPFHKVYQYNKDTSKFSQQYLCSTERLQPITLLCAEPGFWNMFPRVWFARHETSWSQPPEGNCQILCTFTEVYISESLYFLFKIVSCMIRIFVNTSCTNLNRRIVIRPAMAWNISENLRMKLVYRENTNFQSLNDHKKLEDLQLLPFSHASNSSPSPPPRVVTLNSATGVE